MSDLAQGVKELFKAREQFVVLGLTGRTGSGCTTAAGLLSQTFADLNPPRPQTVTYKDNEERKYRILYEYAESNWRPFHRIQIRDIITSFILEASFTDFKDFVSHLISEHDGHTRSTFEHIQHLEEKYTTLHNEWAEIESTSNADNKLEKRSLFYLNQLPPFTQELKGALNKLSEDNYVKIYQLVGDNIRSSGHAFKNEFDPINMSAIARRTNEFIKALRAPSKANREGFFAVIDAIRNPFEAFFFRERYSAFYLISINTPPKSRINRLLNLFDLNPTQIERIDNKEYPEKLEGHKRFISQDIQKCIEWSDIHLNNPQEDAGDPNLLKQQLVWYVALILHPGLVIPTATERAMQIANVAKLNSGCISRQVGAVVTDENYSVKAVGWNNTPQGQIPCILRDVRDCLHHQDKTAFSPYENTNKKFLLHLNKVYGESIKADSLPVLEGRRIPFCFKDIKNSLDREKNQIHTRSLHAEENAFLQVIKYGGQGILGGILFTTASPCELCAKKAYQLGISKIVYVDPYPGIANDHILQGGSKSPELELFRGAIGRAYQQLYQPVYAYKDELAMLLGIDKPVPVENIGQQGEIEKLEQENASLKARIAELERGDSTGG